MDESAQCSSYLLNIWIWFILSGAYLLRNTVLYDGKLLHTDPVQNIYWVLCLKESSLPKNDIFNEMPACRPTVAALLLIEPAA